MTEEEETPKPEEEETPKPEEEQWAKKRKLIPAMLQRGFTRRSCCGR